MNKISSAKLFELKLTTNLIIKALVSESKQRHFRRLHLHAIDVIGFSLCSARLSLATRIEVPIWCALKAAKAAEPTRIAN